MERVRVAPVRLGVVQEVPGPRPEVGQREQGLDVIDDHARVLHPVACPEVEALAVQDPVDRLLEGVGVDETDEVRDLVDPLRLVERTQPCELVRVPRQHSLGPLPGDLHGALR